MFRTRIALFLLPGLLAAAAPPDDRVAAAAKRVADRTQEAINKLTEDVKSQTVSLKRFRSGVIDRTAKTTIIPSNEKQPVRFPSKADKDETVAAAERSLAGMNERLKRYADGTEFVYGTLTYPLTIGDFGQIYAGTPRVNVQQVVDANTMLIRVSYSVPAFKILGSQPGRQTVVESFQTEQITLMVKGVSTKGATDGAGFDLPQVFEVTGTKTYRTVGGGSNTVFVVEPLDTERVEAYLRQNKNK